MVLPPCCYRLAAAAALQVLLGIWGNSDPNNIQHWLPLVTTEWPPTTDLQWDEPTSTCHNVAQGLQVGVLVVAGTSVGMDQCMEPSRAALSVVLSGERSGAHQRQHEAKDW